MRKCDYSTSLLNFKIHLCKSKFSVKRPDQEKQKINLRPDLALATVQTDNQGLMPVHFPFEKPYACQENYIKAMIKALRKR
jgi:hypothetical protein